VSEQDDPYYVEVVGDEVYVEAADGGSDIHFRPADDATHRREHPEIVLRDDCRPDELCIGCRREMGDYHDVLCYVYANNRLFERAPESAYKETQ
jgi:hypothetical protein